MSIDHPTGEEAKVALDSLPKAERNEVLSLPAKEAMTIIRLLIAFPGSRFVKDAA